LITIKFKYMQLVLQSNKNKNSTEYYKKYNHSNIILLLIDSEIVTQL